MTPLHLAMLVTITLFWGVNFVAVKYAVTAFPPLMANALRFGLVLVVLSPFLKRSTGRMRPLLATAFTLGVLHFGLVFTGMAYAQDLAPVIVAAQANVPFATLIAVFLLGERIGPWRSAGILLSFLGVLMTGLSPQTFADPAALLIILASALAYGAVANMMRFLAGIPAFTVQAWTAVMALAVCLPLSLVVEQDHLGRLMQADILGWGGLLYGVIFASILGHGGMTWLLQRYAVTIVAPYLLLMPVFALAATMAIEGERLDMLEWAGSAVTLAGLAIITLRNRIRAGL